ncbi:MAG: transcription antitermination factor NusB [Gemmatimonadota bacterium]
MSRAGADPRIVAHRILEAVEAGAFADRVAEAYLPGLPERDRGLAMELAFGCIRLRARLDTVLAQLVDRPLDRLDPSVLLWLRLGVYQLRETRVPAHAAVFETVRGAREGLNRGAAGLVNAVLRAAAAGEGGSAFPAFEREPLAYLSTFGSHPEWLVRRWLSRWPAEKVRRLVELDNRPPRITFRMLEAVDAEGGGGTPGGSCRWKTVPGWPRCRELVSGVPAEALTGAAAVVQDPAASAVVDYAGRDLPGPVLDACAAPGGKTAGLAWQCPRARPYVAADVAPERLRRVAAGMERLRLDVRCVVMDARRPALGEAGTVLLDAPCTGTGVLRRRPDARWRIDRRRLESAVRRQRELLDACATVVAPGGLLVYGTCSLEPEENELQVEAFLRRHGDFHRDPPGPRSDYPPGVVTPAGDLWIVPWRHDTDGAYAARLRRSSAP